MIMFIPDAHIKAHRPMCEKHNINRVIVLISVPMSVPCMASLALPMAWSEAVRGAWT